MSDTTRSVAVNPDSPAHTSHASPSQREDATDNLQSEEENAPGAFTRERGGTNDSGGHDGRLINGTDQGADGT
jgi:hypothetical protein